MYKAVNQTRRLKLSKLNETLEGNNPISLEYSLKIVPVVFERGV